MVCDHVPRAEIIYLFERENVHYPKYREVYTIRNVRYDDRHGLFFHLVEIRNTDLDFASGRSEPAFGVRWFKPVRPVSIETLRQLRGNLDARKPRPVHA